MRMRVIIIVFSLLVSFCCHGKGNELFHILSLADTCDTRCFLESDFISKRQECVDLIPNSFYRNNDTLFIIENYDFIFHKYHINLLTESYNYRFEYKNNSLKNEKSEQVHFNLNQRQNNWDINTCIKDTFLYDYNMAVYWSENGSSVSLDDHTILICTLVERNKTDIFLDRLCFFGSWIEQRLFDSYQRKMRMP